MKKILKFIPRILLGFIALFGTLALSGCFTAFTPATDFCTNDPKNTAAKQCPPDAAR